MTEKRMAPSAPQEPKREEAHGRSPRQEEDEHPAIAFNRWFSVGAAGDPFFPGLYDESQLRGVCWLAFEAGRAHQTARGGQQAAPAPGWQPIETAPERRKVFVSWINALGHRRTTCAAFYPAGTLDLDEAPDDILNEDGTNAEDGWFECQEAGDSVDWHLNEKLTHWMPLPAPPGRDTET